MKPCFRIVVLCMGILNVHAIAATEEGGMKTVEKQVEKESLILSATLHEKCFAGERIDLMICIKNQRKGDVVYYKNIPVRDFNIMVHDSKGKPVSLTEFGKLMLPPLANREKFGNKSKVLSPGNDVKVRINLSRLFDLTKAADYNLLLEREMILDEKDNSGELKRINLKLEVPFKVSEPSK